MSIHSWQRRTNAKVSKPNLKMTFVRFLVFLSWLNLTTACSAAEMRPRNGIGERPPRDTQQEATRSDIAKNSTSKQPIRVNQEESPNSDIKSHRRVRRTRGIQQESLDSDMLSGQLLYQGQMRTYHLHLPKDYNRNQSLPLVLAFHGGFGRGDRLARNTSFNELADREGFIVVYPDALDKHWNDGRGTTNPDIDDVGFVKALIERLIRFRNIDSSRIYAMGISNGGFFTQRLACEMSDRIAAFAAVSATLPEQLKSSCQPKNPVSMLMIHSPEDQLVPWNGGETGGRGGRVLSVPDTIAFWRQENDSSPKAETEALPVIDPDDSTRVSMSRYSGGRRGSEVILYTIKGGGHGWPNSKNPQSSSRDERASRQLKASQIIWNFFQQHSLS